MSTATFDAAFWKALILMLADKLVIGAIIAGVVYLAQKRLEAFRSEQSLQNEINKERIHSVAKGWNALNAWDLTVTHLIARFASLVRERCGLSDNAGLDELGLPDLVAIADWLNGQLRANSSAIAEIKRDCEDVLKPFLIESVARSNNAKAVMQENRFWFGKELYDHCRHFHAALHQVCISFEKKDFADLPKRLKVLEARRQNVLIVLQTIRSLPREQLEDSEITIIEDESEKFPAYGKD